MRILLVDDEALARDRLAALIEELGPPYQVVGQACNGAEALEQQDRLGADLILMDIRMPMLDGLEVAERLAELKTPPAVVFTTAYEEHSLRAFESRAIDYLLKPVRKERLLRALERARSLTLAQLQALSETSEHAPPCLQVTYRGGIRRLPLEQISYLQADSKYVTIHHTSGEYLSEESLKTLESRYPDYFLRIHRNTLVALNSLLGLEKGPDGVMYARLAACSNPLPISRRHLAEVRKRLKYAP